MALYLLSVKYISRRQGRCAVAAAAYRNGERLQYDGRIYDFTKRRDIVYKEIILPENAPLEYSNSQILWSEVEKAEDNSTRRKAARTAREIVIALPRELTFESHKELVREFVIDTFVRDGMCAEIVIHRGNRKGNGHVEGDHLKVSGHNPHAHIMLTTRFVGPDGFGLKNREWDKTEILIHWRERWANYQNRAFARKGLKVEVSHRSNNDRGIDREPMKHLGPILSAMERRDINTYLGDRNREIEARNEERYEQKRLCQQEQDKNHERGRGLSH